MKVSGFKLKALGAILAMIFSDPARSAGTWYLEKWPEGTRIALPQTAKVGLKIPAEFLGLKVTRRGETLMIQGPGGRVVRASPRLGLAEAGGAWFKVSGTPAGAWTKLGLGRILSGATGLPLDFRGDQNLIVLGQGGGPRGVGDEGGGYRVKRVVLDAGHGGRDPGAAGPSKYPEKDITLDIVQRLARTLREKAPDLEVILTRDKDAYVELKKRTEIANSHSADLFLSVHCNARKKDAPSGSEVYIFNPRVSTSVQAEEVARENAEVKDPLLAWTLADLGNQAWRERSLNLGIMVLDGLQERLLLKPRLVREANYYVLGFVDMPSVLVEVAYLNNPKDERRLKEPNFRETVAEVLAEAILKYRNLQNPAARSRPEDRL